MLNKFSDIVGVVGFSISSLLLFHLLPEPFSSDVNSIIAYALMAIIFPYFIWSYRLPTMAYFRFPEISFTSAIGFLLALGLGVNAILSPRAISLPLSATLQGLVYLAVIGIGEEIVSRGLVFGILYKYGKKIAIFGSSLAFGLMHLNIYLGEYWDPWQAFWHVCAAFGFGVLACAIMLATKSIWVACIYHALVDWTVVFSKKAEGDVIYPDATSPLWDGLVDGFFSMSIDLFLALFLLWIVRGPKIWRFFRKPFKFFGLIEKEDEATTSQHPSKFDESQQPLT
jgi:membrane protease YdiL (CAAX protease family)